MAAIAVQIGNNRAGEIAGVGIQLVGIVGQLRISRQTHIPEPEPCPLYVSTFWSTCGFGKGVECGTDGKLCELCSEKRYESDGAPKVDNRQSLNGRKRFS